MKVARTVLFGGKFREESTYQDRPYAASTVVSYCFNGY